MAASSIGICGAYDADFDLASRMKFQLHDQLASREVITVPTQRDDGYPVLLPSGLTEKET